MSNTELVAQIIEEKARHKKEIDVYAENIREHISEYGETPCDYLHHRQQMHCYHRGAWKALDDLLTNE